ncbi:MAG: hypothetical protein ABEH64_12915, partial [Salinirussus sp.]
MDSRAAVLLCCLLLVVPPATAIGGAGAESGQVRAPLTTPDEFDTTRFRIAVFENGSAEWTIEHSRVLENDTEIEQFETFAARFNEEETDVFQAFKMRAKALLAFGRNATGRDMRAVDFDRLASVNELGQTRGVLELSFRWTEFARVNGTRVHVGDVFEGGMYIAQDQQLVLKRGPSLRFLEVRPSPDSTSEPESIRASDTVTWTGERQFADQRPAVVLGPRSTTTTGGGGSTDGGGAGSGGDAPPADESGGSGVALLLGGLVVILGLGAAVAWYGGFIPGRDGGWAPSAPESPSGTASPSVETSGAAESAEIA